MELFGDHPNLTKLKSPAVLPKLCVRCKTSEHVEQIKGHLSYASPMGMLIPVAYLTGAGRKTLQIEYSICSACAGHMKKWKAIAVLSWIVTAILFLLFLVIQDFSVLPDKFAKYSVIPVLLLCAFAFYCSRKQASGLSIEKCMNDFFYVKGVPRIDVDHAAKN